MDRVIFLPENVVTQDNEKSLPLQEIVEKTTSKPTSKKTVLRTKEKETNVEIFELLYVAMPEKYTLQKTFSYI